MTNPKSRILAAVAGALAMGASAAWAADATQDQKIAELEAKVSAMEAKQAQNGKEMAATIDSVLRDAEKRSQLLATMGDTGAGYDNGFFIRGGEGWLLRPGVIFQFWNVTDYRENTSGAKDDEIENGFEIHRVKLTLEGTAFTKDLEYNFTWDVPFGGGGLTLTDAWTKYMFSDDWGFRVGQFRDPVSHEFLTSDGRLMAVERSIADTILGGANLGYTQGATLIYGGYQKNNPLNVEVGLTDGAFQVNTNYQKGSANLGDTSSGTDFGVAGRVEWKAMGNWASYRDFSAMGNKEDLLVIGLGGDWTQFGNDDLITGALDAQFETGNLGLFAALYVQHGRFGGDDSDDVTNWGGTVQASYMLNNQWELFGRWSFVDFDNEIAFGPDDSEDFFHELTVGVNYYLGNNGSAGHRAKVTVDLSWLPNGTPQGLTGLGYSSDSNGDNEIAIRGQFQLWL